MRRIALGCLIVLCVALIVNAVVNDDLEWARVLPVLPAVVIGRLIGQRRERRRSE